MWNRIKGALLRFMTGRYGVDTLNRVLLWIYLILFLIGVFTDSLILSLLSTIVAVCMILRMFSRNTLARSRENQAFLSLKNRITAWYKLQKDKYRDRKTHIYRTCPSCRATLRLPKTPGEHTVRCPKCGNRFSVQVK